MILLLKDSITVYIIIYIIDESQYILLIRDY